MIIYKVRSLTTSSPACQHSRPPENPRLERPVADYSLYRTSFPATRSSPTPTTSKMSTTLSTKSTAERSQRALTTSTLAQTLLPKIKRRRSRKGPNRSSMWSMGSDWISWEMSRVGRGRLLRRRIFRDNSRVCEPLLLREGNLRCCWSECWQLGTGYLKKVVEKLKEAGKDEDFIKGFQKGVQGYYTKNIVPNFGDLDFYTGESMDPDGMYVLRLSRAWHTIFDWCWPSFLQGRLSQLPRGWCHTLCHYLEAWLVGNEGLDIGDRCQNGVCAVCLALLSRIRRQSNSARFETHNREARRFAWVMFSMISNELELHAWLILSAICWRHVL